MFHGGIPTNGIDEKTEVAQGVTRVTAQKSYGIAGNFVEEAVRKVHDVSAVTEQPPRCNAVVKDHVSVLSTTHEVVKDMVGIG